jgi:hypothetical protein
MRVVQHVSAMIKSVIPIAKSVQLLPISYCRHLSFSQLKPMIHISE